MARSDLIAARQCGDGKRRCGQTQSEHLARRVGLKRRHAAADSAVDARTAGSHFGRVLQSELGPKQEPNFNETDQRREEDGCDETKLHRRRTLRVFDEREKYHWMRTVDCAVSAKLSGSRG